MQIPLFFGLGIFWIFLLKNLLQWTVFSCNNPCICRNWKAVIFAIANSLPVNHILLEEQCFIQDMKMYINSLIMLFTPYIIVYWLYF